MDITRRDLKTMKQEPKESFSTFITKLRSKATQMMNRPSEDEQLVMVVRNLLPVYHKYLFAQCFPNFKDLIVVGTQIEDPNKFNKNSGSSSKTTKVSNIH